MESKNLICTRSVVGKLMVECRGLTMPEAAQLDGFLRITNQSSGHLFDRQTRVNIDYFEDGALTRTRLDFENGAPVVFMGCSMPTGWQLRQSEKEFIFYVPKYRAYVTLSKDSTVGELKVTLTGESKAYRLLQLAAIDLFQLGTTRALIWSTALKLRGMGVLLSADSGFGKTSMVTQLIKTKFDISLISEDRTLLADGSAYCISRRGIVRQGALHYLGLPDASDTYVDFSAYVDCLPNLQRVDAVLLPSINFDGIYGLEEGINVPKSIIKPMNRDWFSQVVPDDELAELVAKKGESLKFLPETGTRVKFSVDADKTASLLGNLLR